MEGKFVEQLDLCLDLWCSLSEVGHVLLDFLVPHLGLYVEFYDNQFVAREVLNRHLIKDRPTKVGKSQRACEETVEKGQINYSDMIDMISSRLPTYLSYVNKLIHVTGKGQSDHAKLTHVAEVLAAKTEEMKARGRSAEDVTKLMGVQRRIDRCIHAPFRRFEHEGPLKKVSPKGVQARQWFLFSESIIHCKAKGKDFIWKSETLLATAWVRDLPDSQKLKNAFQIVAPTKTFTVIADFPEEKAIWMHKIHRCIDALTRADPLLIHKRGKVKYKPKKGLLTFGYIDPQHFDPLFGKGEYIPPWQPVETRQVVPKQTAAGSFPVVSSTTIRDALREDGSRGEIVAQESGTKLAKQMEAIRQREEWDEKERRNEPVAPVVAPSAAPPPLPGSGPKASAAASPAAAASTSAVIDEEPTPQVYRPPAKASPAPAPAVVSAVVQDEPAPQVYRPPTKAATTPAPAPQQQSAAAVIEDAPAPQVYKKPEATTPTTPIASTAQPVVAQAVFRSAATPQSNNNNNNNNNTPPASTSAPPKAAAVVADEEEDVSLPMCLKCSKRISEAEYVSLGGGSITLHRACFACFRCGRGLAGQQFTAKSGVPQCRECYLAANAPQCSGCGQPVVGECLKAGGKPWHPNCFQCVTCSTSLADTGFYFFEEKPYCDKHHPKLMAQAKRATEVTRSSDARLSAHQDPPKAAQPPPAAEPPPPQQQQEEQAPEEDAKMCSACSKAITDGKAVNAVGRFFHLACFRCPFCSQAITDKFVLTKVGEAAHKECKAKDKAAKKEKKKQAAGAAGGGGGGGGGDADSD
jgi:hypothetical protein